MLGSARFAMLLPFVVAVPLSAAAQDRSQELLGMRLFNQSCRVCHTKPQMTSPQYGPVLSMNTLGGKVDLIRQFISNGTARMPGFKYQFTPTQIDAIATYVATLPAPPQAAPAVGKTGTGRNAD
jgi:mono/diheme cytochrome c family protein